MPCASIRLRSASCFSRSSTKFMRCASWSACCLASIAWRSVSGSTDIAQEDVLDDDAAGSQRSLHHLEHLPGDRVAAFAVQRARRVRRGDCAHHGVGSSGR